jgi:hypothetical protein
MYISPIRLLLDNALIRKPKTISIIVCSEIVLIPYYSVFSFPISLSKLCNLFFFLSFSNSLFSYCDMIVMVGMQNNQEKNEMILSLHYSYLLPRTMKRLRLIIFVCIMSCSSFIPLCTLDLNQVCLICTQGFCIIIFIA